MKKGTYGLPNVMPNGVLEPIEHMDLVMAKIESDAHQPYTGVDEKLKAKSRAKE